MANLASITTTTICGSSEIREKSKWRLRIEGLVRQPLSLRYEDIGRLPNVSLTQDFRCLEGWIVRGVAWQGVRVSSVFELAELETEATSVMFSSGDYNTVTPISKSLEYSTILALGMRVTRIAENLLKQSRISVCGVE